MTTEIEPQNRRKTNKQQLSEYSAAERAGMFRQLLDRLVLTWKLFWDGRVGFWPKTIPLLSIAYVLSPLDFLPELLAPVLGPLIVVDDIGLLIAGLTLFVQVAPPDVVAEHLRELRSKGLVGAGLESEDRDEGDIIDGYAEVIDE